VGASEATPLDLWKGVRTVLRMLREQTPSTSLFQITDTLLTLLGFFWDSVFFGIPRSARTYMLGPAGSGMHILAPNGGSGMTHHPF